MCVPHPPLHAPSHFVPTHPQSPLSIFTITTHSLTPPTLPTLTHSPSLSHTHTTHTTHSPSLTHTHTLTHTHPHTLTHTHSTSLPYTENSLPYKVTHKKLVDQKLLDRLHWDSKKKVGHGLCLLVFSIKFCDTNP